MTKRLLCSAWHRRPAENTARIQLSVVPEEMRSSSAALTLSLAADTAQLADESGGGVASAAAKALVETIGQVRYSSCFRV